MFNTINRHQNQKLRRKEAKTKKYESLSDHDELQKLLSPDDNIEPIKIDELPEKTSKIPVLIYIGISIATLSSYLYTYNDAMCLDDVNNWIEVTIAIWFSEIMLKLFWKDPIFTMSFV